MNEVWPARYSLAALPSITRAAPAKNRRLSTTAGTSSMAAPTGLPTFRDSSRPSSSARASIASASFRSIRLRSCGVVYCQVSNAAAADSTARSTSSSSDAGTEAMTVPSAGGSTVHGHGQLIGMPDRPDEEAHEQARMPAPAQPSQSPGASERDQVVGQAGHGLIGGQRAIGETLG